MNTRPNLLLLAATMLLLALAACGDDDDNPTGGGPNDDTAPVIASVTPVDEYHVDVTFDERVTKDSAEDESNYSLSETTILQGPNTAPGDPYVVGGATLSEDEKTVTLATAASMGGLHFALIVHDVSDVTGNFIGEEGSAMGFTSSSAPDQTAPTVLEHAPVANAQNVVLNPTIVVIFSEALQSPDVALFHNGGLVPTTVTLDGAKVTMTPNSPLGNYETYTVTARGTDFAGNVLSLPASWSFTTRLYLTAQSNTSN